jgi:hypothetical protein
MLQQDDDFRHIEFSPNDEGMPAPLHIFEHHGIKRQLQMDHPQVEQVDEDMNDEENLCRLSQLETTENLNHS